MSVSQAGPKSGRNLYIILVAAVSALSGLLFGYDTGVISGAILLIRDQFHLSSLMQETIVSAVLLGALVGAGISGMLSDRLGRKRVVILSAMVFAAGGIATGLAPDAVTLAAGRVWLGLAVGVASCIAPLYISEVAPVNIRGALVFLNQLAITIGILCAYIVDYAFVSVPEGWRWMLGLSAIPAAVLWIGMAFMPESPRWLVCKDREPEARRILQRLRGDACIRQELAEIQECRQNGTAGWGELFQPRLRLVLVIGLALALMQQVTGINTVIYYAPSILESAGFRSASLSILGTMGIGLINVLATVVSVFLVDRLGRRPLLLTGLVGMAISMSLIGLAFASPAMAHSLGWLTVGGLMLYVTSFAISLGPIFWLIIAEIYPLTLRARAMSLATAASWVANLLVSMTFLSLVEGIGHAATFWLFGSICVVSWFFVYAQVPETKGRSLEELEAQLASPALQAESESLRPAEA
jgi:MFS transporter, SP family, galactose:H+ symporter